MAQMAAAFAIADDSGSCKGQTLIATNLSELPAL